MRVALACLALLAAPVWAQNEAPPPPPLAESDAAQVSAEPLAEVPPPPPFEELPPKIQSPDEIVPEISIRPGKDGGRIEEYRENGRLLYVRVVPERGIPYVLIDADNDGEVDRAPPMSNEVLPVHYDIRLPKRKPEDEE